MTALINRSFVSQIAQVMGIWFSLCAAGFAKTTAEILDWHQSPCPLCYGFYQMPIKQSVAEPGEIRVLADEVDFAAAGRSVLSGNVEVFDAQQQVSAQKAYLYRDAKTQKITQIKLFNGVRFQESGKLIIANEVVLFPLKKSGVMKNVLYRVDYPKKGAILPAWGNASYVERFENENYLFQQATYTTCPPVNPSWQISAREITLDHEQKKGVAKDATLRLGGHPVLYTPYLSFPTTKERKSGFLFPSMGYSNVTGGDIALPYYLNLAPNYDATLIPQWYTRRGVMYGGEFRFLGQGYSGILQGNVLPHDKVYSQFLNENRFEYPMFNGDSSTRWSATARGQAELIRNLNLNVNVEQVSDDYYLQDFSTNLAVATENQLLRQADLSYTTDHWLFSGMVQSYQTLHPINEGPIMDIYERLPQLMAHGLYTNLPLHAQLELLGQFDYYRWPVSIPDQQQGPRYHLNPIISFPHIFSWWYITPSVELVENYYDVYRTVDTSSNQYNITVPRFSVDTGLFLERSTRVFGESFTNTLEPRLYYLNVPFQNQSMVPVYDSAYMIFNRDQLFRTNRFSGFDRIGDANQLTYALTSRWLQDSTGMEKASFTIGQIRYFSDRRVQLCQNPDGFCFDDMQTLGYLSQVSAFSPFVARATYRMHPFWYAVGDYVYDPATNQINNGHLNFRFQPGFNQILSLGYTYLVNGDITPSVPGYEQNSALQQATVAFAWPFTPHWSSLGAYSYNLSKHYDMLGFLGIQYDNCCWTMRLTGGRSFKSLTPSNRPQYNSNVYLQVLFKGLGSVANADPAGTINSYIPGYVDVFHR